MATLAALPRTSDPAQLVRMTLDSTCPIQAREGARAALVPVVREQAARVAGRAGQASRDLGDVAVSHVLRDEVLRRYDPARCFLRFVRVVLRNKLRDLIRAQTTRQAKYGAALPESLTAPVVSRGSGQDEPTGARVHPLATGDRFVDEALCARFSAADQARLLTLEPRLRFVLVSTSLLFLKLPEAVWAQTLRECRLALPFSLERLLSCENRVERRDYLAELLGCKRNTLDQWWCRHKHVLAELEFVQLFLKGSA